MSAVGLRELAQTIQSYINAQGQPNAVPRVYALSPNVTPTFGFQFVTLTNVPCLAVSVANGTGVNAKRVSLNISYYAPLVTDDRLEIVEDEMEYFRTHIGRALQLYNNIEGRRFFCTQPDVEGIQIVPQDVMFPDGSPSISYQVSIDATDTEIENQPGSLGAPYYK